MYELEYLLLQYFDPRSCIFPHLEEKAARPTEIWDYPINLNSVSKPTSFFFPALLLQVDLQEFSSCKRFKVGREGLLAFYGLFTLLTI